MRRTEFVTSVAAGVATLRAPLQAALTAPRFAFFSNFWVNLHHRLDREASAVEDRRRGSALGPEQRQLTTTVDRLPASMRDGWRRAVEAYRSRYAIENRDLLFDAELASINRVLTTTAGGTPPALRTTIASVLVSAAPI